MFNFIKNFGYSIVNSAQHASSDVANLKLEDLNVRKCINLELHACLVQKIYPAASLGTATSSISLVETVTALIRSRHRPMKLALNLELELIYTII